MTSRRDYVDFDDRQTAGNPVRQSESSVMSVLNRFASIVRDSLVVLAVKVCCRHRLHPAKRSWQVLSHIRPSPSGCPHPAVPIRL